MKKIIELVEYDSNWPKLYDSEALLIREALRDNLIELHHIGSTSVSGLIAKPKIDILAVVYDPIAAREALQILGMQYRGEYNIPLHYCFTKRGVIDINLHLYEKSHPEIELNIRFRDYLRSNLDIRDAYAKLKLELIQNDASFDKNNSPFTNYTLLKGDFIRSVLRKAGFDRMRILKVNDATELEAAKSFHKQYMLLQGKVGDDLEIVDITNENHTHIILYQGVDIVGYSHIYFASGARAIIPIFIIEQSMSNGDRASIFLDLIEQWLVKIGHRSISVCVRQDEISLYVNNGYIELPSDELLDMEYVNHLSKVDDVRVFCKKELGSINRRS